MPHDDPLGLGSDWFTTRPEQDEAETSTRGTAAPSAGGPQGSAEEPSDWDGYDDAPPPDWDGYDAPPPGWDGDVPPYDGPPDSGGGRPVFTPLNPDDPALILATLRRSLASVDNRAASEVSSLCGRILAASDLLDELDETDRRAWVSLLEALTLECSLLDGVGSVTLSHVPAAWFTSERAQAELAAASEIAASGNLPAGPYEELEALIEALQAFRSKQAAQVLIRVVDERAPAAEKMAAFRAIPAPTRIREVQNTTWARTAAEWFEHDAAQSESTTQIILSSGYPTLDMACAGTGDEPGLIRPGEFWIGGAATGHGKSAMTRRLITAMTEDLTSVEGWNRPGGKTILAFTEEEAVDVARAAMLGRGQPFHHLAANITLAKVGESRKRLVEVVYQQVAAAERNSQQNGTPASEEFPYLFTLDYIQAIKEAGEGADTDAISRTADLLMRGIAAWDIEMMEAISGLSFQAYTGMKWPEGYDDHRVAVFVLSQLRKEGANIYYREGKSTPSDFAVVDANGTLCWDPQENDYAIPDRSDLRGSGVLLNHATGLIFFHRSQPTASLRRGADGEVIGLSDTRARCIIAKARKSVSMPFVPFRFDSNPEGFRGQFYDDYGHKHCVVEGRMPLQSCYHREGDPMLPVRPSRSPFSGVAY